VGDFDICLIPVVQADSQDIKTRGLGVKLEIEIAHFE
jgi:hypothetical protein